VVALPPPTNSFKTRSGRQRTTCICSSSLAASQSGRMEHDWCSLGVFGSSRLSLPVLAGKSYRSSDTRSLMS
jgi:hypothetical protein